MLAVKARCARYAVVRIHFCAMPTKKKDSYAIAVGERLAAARKAVVPAMTQSKAAELLSKSLGKHITAATISGYESGHRLPHVFLVKRAM